LLFFDSQIFSNNRKPKTENRKRLVSLSSEWYFLLGLALMGLVIFGYRLGVPGLMDPDEGRYAEIAREILVLKDWLIPHLNHLPYLEKPPLGYWLTALSFGGLGETELAARLPAAVSALAGLFLAYGLGRAFWGPGAGFLSAVVLATCPGYVALGRILTLDMTFSLFLNLAAGLGYLALSRERQGLWPWAYLALGLAVLTKGPVAVVLAGLIWLLWVLYRKLPLKSLVSPGGWLILGALSLPWFAWVEWRYPDFFRFFLLEQHLGRFLTAASHPEPFYYYAPIILGLMLPWSFLLPWVVACRGRLPDPKEHRPFLLLWAGAILVFFSLSRGKLVPYILPALLPLALLLGEGLAGLLGPGRRFLLANRGLKVSLLVWAVAGVGLSVVYFWPPGSVARELAKIGNFSPLLIMGLLVFALTPIAALWWRQAGVLFLGPLLLSTLVPWGVETLSLSRSPRQIGQTVKAQWQPGTALVGVNLYSQAVSFYGGQVFHLLDFRTELEFGRRLQPGSGLFFATPKEMAAFAGSRPRTLFYLKVQYLPLLEQELPGKLRLLARHKDCILLGYEGK
jgi:4-amino-4-deoxy-L-arabinose transferase-like glycosyltransferase